jgi:hypothetical protein
MGFKQMDLQLHDTSHHTICRTHERGVDALQVAWQALLTTNPALSAPPLTSQSFDFYNTAFQPALLLFLRLNFCSIVSFALFLSFSQPGEDRNHSSPNPGTDRGPHARPVT